MLESHKGLLRMHVFSAVMQEPAVTLQSASPHKQQGVNDYLIRCYQYC